MNATRRILLKFTSAAGMLTVAAAAGLVKAGTSFAASWNKNAFESKATAEALKSLGASNMIESKDIVITAPDIAENGAVVPVAVSSKIPKTQSISILAEKNPFPLTSTYDMTHNADAYVSMRLKIGETSNVRAIVKADGKFYTAAKEVKVTIGGCGG